MLVQILKKLITFKTTTRNFAETKKSFAWIKGFVKDLPIYKQEFVINGFPSLMLTTKKTKKPLLLLQSHIDVVPGPKKMFLPKVKGNALYGRGSWDMKFAVACYLRLLKEIGQNLKHYDLGVMITSDEEIGGENGVGALLEKGYSSKVCVLPDGGTEGQIEVAAKGVWHLRIESRGKAGRASRPWAGKNALWNLMDFLNILKGEFVKEPCGIKNHYHNTFNLGKVSGGHAINGVPGFAEAFLDIRFVPEMKVEQLRKMVKRIKDKFSGIKVEELVLAESYKVDQDNPHFKEFVRLYGEAYGKKPRLIFAHGSSDARFFAQKGIPVILSAPAGQGNHSDEEWVDVGSLKTFYGLLKTFVKKTAEIS